jgi:hypothetical protein
MNYSLLISSPNGQPSLLLHVLAYGHMEVFSPEFSMIAERTKVLIQAVVAHHGTYLIDSKQRLHEDALRTMSFRDFVHICSEIMRVRVWVRIHQLLLIHVTCFDNMNDIRQSFVIEHRENEA